MSKSCRRAVPVAFTVVVSLACIQTTLGAFCGYYESLFDGAECSDAVAQECASLCCECMARAPLCRGDVASLPDFCLGECSANDCGRCVSLTATCTGLCAGSGATVGITLPTLLQPNATYNEPELVHLACPSGFEAHTIPLPQEAVAIANPTSECTFTGEFSPLYACMAISCPLITVNNGQVLATRDSLYGERVNITCNEGFRLSNDATDFPVCQADGTFEQFASCVPVSCGIFSVGDNASSAWNGVELFYNESTTYEVTCKLGFQPASQVFKCQKDKTFSAIIPCTNIQCGELFVENGVVLCGAEVDSEPCALGHISRYPEQHRITCNLGYEPFQPVPAATDVADCTINGTFGPHITCAETNECLQNLDTCDDRSTTCQNNDGSFTCPCRPGFSSTTPLAIDQTNCTDIDECQDINICHFQAKCENSIGSFQCLCNVGWGGSGKVCTVVTLRMLKTPESLPTIVGFGLTVQPLLELRDDQGNLSKTPWSESEQRVYGQLQELASTTWTDSPDGILTGEINVLAPNGVAKYTDLEIRTAKENYRLKFSMLSQWGVRDVFTGPFNVLPGPPTRLIIKDQNQPSTTGTTSLPLEKQPVIGQADVFGNINPDAIAIDVVAISEKDSTHTGFEGYRGGEIENNQVVTIRGEARFTRLILYGLGPWKLKFRAFLSFQLVSVEAAEAITLSQIEVEEVVMTINMDISSWNEDLEIELVAITGEICGLSTDAIEITGVAAGSVLASMKIFTSNSSAYGSILANDITKADSKLAQFGVSSVIANGIAIDRPAELVENQTVVVIPDPSMSYKNANAFATTMEVTVGGAYAVGLAMALLKEVLTTFSAVAMSHSLEDDGTPLKPMGLIASYRVHQGWGLRSGGAFRSLIHHVQFVSVCSEIGGKTGIKDKIEGDWNMTWNNRTGSMLPDAFRLMSARLDWTNFRGNLTYILQDPDVFPRPCDAPAQQILLGTLGICAVVVLIVEGVRGVALKSIETYTLYRFGEASRAENLQFPKWETILVSVMLLGLSRAAGLAIGSDCQDWSIGGAFFAVVPAAMAFIYWGCTYYSVRKSGVEWKSVPPPDSLLFRIFAINGQWIDLSDKTRILTMQEKLLKRYSALYADLRGDRHSYYYTAFTAFRSVVVGITAGATADYRISGSLFLALFTLELLFIFALRPFRDNWRNFVEGFLSFFRLVMLIVAFSFLEGNISDESAEEALIGISVVTILAAIFNLWVLACMHAWILVGPRRFKKAAVIKDEIPEKEGTKSARFYGVAADNEAVALADAVNIINIRIEGATALPAHDLTKNDAHCKVMLGPVPHAHYKNFSGAPAFHFDGDLVFETISSGHTLTKTAAYWNKDFAFRMKDPTAALSFILTEKREGLVELPLGSLVIPLPVLLAELQDSEDNVVSQRYDLMGPHGEPPKAGAKNGPKLSLQIKGRPPPLWHVRNVAGMSSYRLQSMEESYIAKDTHDFFLTASQKIVTVDDERLNKHAVAGSHVHQQASWKKIMEMDHVKWAVKDKSLIKDSPWHDGPSEASEGLVHGVLMLNDSDTGKLHALEPPPDLAPPQMAPNPAQIKAADTANGEVYYGAQGEGEGADRKKIVNDSEEATALHRSYEDLNSRTAGRPTSIGIGAGTMRRDFTDDPLLSSVTLKPHQ